MHSILHDCPSFSASRDIQSSWLLSGSIVVGAGPGEAQYMVSIQTIRSVITST